MLKKTCTEAELGFFFFFIRSKRILLFEVVRLGDLSLLFSSVSHKCVVDAD